MGITMVKLGNPKRNINDKGIALSENVEGRCLCGKRVILNPEGHPVGPVSAHRPPSTVYAVKDADGLKESRHQSRKARKGAWCPISELLVKLVHSGSVAGDNLD